MIKESTTAGKERWGLTVPPIFADKFEGVFFSVEISGNSLVYTSGTKISVETIQTHNFEKIEGSKKQQRRELISWWSAQ